MFFGFLSVFGGVFSDGCFDLFLLSVVVAMDDVGEALGLLVDLGSHSLAVFPESVSNVCGCPVHLRFGVDLERSKPFERALV